MKPPVDTADYWTVVNGRLQFYNGRQVADVYQEVDGYYVVAFDDRGGCWEASDLILIGELLNRMNAPWNEEVKAYFNDKR